MIQVSSSKQRITNVTTYLVNKVSWSFTGRECVDAIHGIMPLGEVRQMKRIKEVKHPNGPNMSSRGIQDLFENQSTATRIQVKESDGGSVVTKSTPRWDQGLHGLGKGRSFPSGRCHGDLEMALVEQPLSYL